MTELVVFVLASYGATAILAWGRIFDSIRPEEKFFHCPQCLGWWVGLAFALLGFDGLLSEGTSPPMRAFLLACLASGTSYILGVVFDDDGIRVR